MSLLRVVCPAKLNLFLSVGPRDEKGWHPLRTVFQAIDLHDELEIEPAAEDHVTTDAAWLPADNSMTKALWSYRARAELGPLRVHLTKRIPAESGLGGGSTDAAGTLRAAQHLAPKPLSEGELLEVALDVGADVPFFLIGGRAKGEGYGERLTALEDRDERFFVIARPPIGCSTPAMYERLDASERPWREFPEGDLLYNDFLSVAPPECADLIEHLESLDALDAGLTGSGSAVFGRFENHTVAGTAADLLRAQRPECGVWLCRSLNRRESLQVDEI